MKNASDTGRRRPSTFPTGAFVVVVAVVCGGLAISAGYDFIRLSRLRVEYLRNSAAQIVSNMDSQAREPRRSDPDFWQGLFAESISTRGSEVAFEAVFDESGQVVASQGDRFAPAFAASPGFVRSQGTQLYVYELPLRTGMGPGAGVRQRMAPHLLRIGLYASTADFIRWQALAHLAIDGVAIVTLLFLSRYFLRTLNRFLQLKAREDSERHLTALASMAATLAHEIRNPLGAMKGLTQLAQEDLPAKHRMQSLMSTIVSEAERLEHPATDLLTFARPRDPQIGRFDFVQFLSAVKAGLQPKLDAARIHLEILPGAGAFVIESDENGVRQIPLNVPLNAMDSMLAGGSITVRMRPDDKARVLLAEIDDTGPGPGGSFSAPP
jgi:signal transduction histidine kinase